MKLPATTTTILLLTALTLTSPQPFSPSPAICAPMLTLHLYINDLDIYPTQSGIYMAEAQALAIDEGLQCPTKNGILDNGGETHTTSEACKKNQEIKDVLEGLKISTPEEKRAWLRGLRDACVEMDEMVGCPLE